MTHPQHTIGPTGHAGRLLLIEDSPVQAREISLFLQGSGYEVVVAGDGESGLKQLAGSEFDLLLCDLHLPGMNGFEVCRHVKSKAEHSKLPVVLLTRWADPLNVLRGLEAGADGFISKGQRRAEIIERVRRVIERARRPLPADGEPAHVVFLNAEFELSARREQLLEVLLAGFEDTVYLNEKYEQELKLRTRAQEALERSAAELKRSNDELKQFAYVISHDLKEPLRMVASFTKLLDEDLQNQLTDETRRFMAYILEGAERMRTMIDDLLSYSRVGKGNDKTQPTDLNAVQDDVLRNLAVAIDEARAVIRVDPLPTVAGVPSLLLRLFQNLIGNAIKFRGELDPVIHVGAEDKGEYWQFFVRDNGIGIEGRHQQRVFQIFQRLHAREEYEGAGVGLAICRKIVECHGGEIWMESEPGEGTTFFFTIRDPAPRSNREEPAAPGEAGMRAGVLA